MTFFKGRLPVYWNLMQTMYSADMLTRYDNQGYNAAGMVGISKITTPILARAVYVLTRR